MCAGNETIEFDEFLEMMKKRGDVDEDKELRDAFKGLIEPCHVAVYVTLMRHAFTSRLYVTPFRHATPIHVKVHYVIMHCQ